MSDARLPRAGEVVARGYDVVIVGGGSSGCVLAARLSEDPARTVLLLEAGAVPRAADAFPPELLDAGSVRGAVPGRSDNWSFTALLTPERPYTTVRGRILGGSSTVNGAYFIRPRRADFDRWSAASAPAWSYESVLPMLVAMEDDRDFGPSPIHGAGGPVGVSRAGARADAAEVFGAAALELGFGAEPDKNDQAQPGVGPVPTNAVRGIRLNTGLSYLLPALARPNLTVIDRALVRRVVFDGERAVGVEYARDGEASTVAGAEIVLSAGALKSPQLLMLSGIGPEAELRRLGIPVRVAAEGVGTAVSDHPQWVLDWRPARALSSPDGTWMSLALHAHARVGAGPGEDAVAEVLQSTRSMPALLGAPADDAPLPLLVSDLTPRTSGRLRLESADAAAGPVIEYGYLRSGPQLAGARAAVSLAFELLATDAWRQASVTSSPRPASAADLDDWLFTHLGTSMHTCGTVPFGGDDAPVDQFGCVRGVSGLRVADASILPSAPVRGPAVAAVLVGEVVARAMSRDAGAAGQ